MRRVVTCLLYSLMVGFLAAGTTAAASSLERAPDQDEALMDAAARGVAGFLDEDGRLALPQGFSGSLDLAGFRTVLDENGAPRFVAKGGPADPDERWDDGFNLGSGCDGSVLAAVVGPEGELYLGGNFLSCGGVAARNVVRFDPDTAIWSALGSGGGNGVSATVRALAVFGSELYVGGEFTEVNVGSEIAANRIARWDGDTWSPVGSGGGNGVNSTVWALAASGTDLYVGGFFSQANVGSAISTRRIARWNGSNWSALGSGAGNGVNDPVYALAVSDNALYVGGSFTEANVGAAMPANRIALWSGSAWTALGSDGGNGVTDTVRALAVSGSDLYVGGEFIEANVGAAVPTGRIARWNGSSWSALGSGQGNGLSGRVSALAVSGADLYVGGSFTQANVGAAISAGHIARWDGSTWSNLGSGEANGVDNAVLALASAGTELYVGGSFTAALDGVAITANRHRALGRRRLVGAG